MTETVVVVVLLCVVVVVVVNHQHRGRWLGLVQYRQLQTSCCSGVVTPGAVALND